MKWVVRNINKQDEVRIFFRSEQGPEIKTEGAAYYLYIKRKQPITGRKQKKRSYFSPCPSLLVRGTRPEHSCHFWQGAPTRPIHPPERRGAPFFFVDLSYTRWETNWRRKCAKVTTEVKQPPPPSSPLSMQGRQTSLMNTQDIWRCFLFNPIHIFQCRQKNTAEVTLNPKSVSSTKDEFYRNLG